MSGLPVVQAAVFLVAVSVLLPSSSHPLVFISFPQAFPQDPPWKSLEITAGACSPGVRVPVCLRQPRSCVQTTAPELLVLLLFSILFFEEPSYWNKPHVQLHVPW